MSDENKKVSESSQSDNKAKLAEEAQGKSLNLTESTKSVYLASQRYAEFATEFFELQKKIRAAFEAGAEWSERTRNAADPNVCEHGVNTLLSGLCNQCVDSAEGLVQELASRKYGEGL